MKGRHDMQQRKMMIFCRHTDESGRRCNNPICIKDGARLTVRKRGREVKIELTAGQTVEITCERCGGITEIKE